MPIARKPPHEYEVSVERPSDFHEFWADVMSEVDAVPLNPELDFQESRSTEEVEVYEIHYGSLDNLRVAGWYCKPKESYVEPPYPGLLIVPGYVSEPALPKSWAKMGYAVVGVAPRGKLRSNRYFNPGYPGLLVHNVVDRHTYSYRGFYIDACRAVDFLLTRPEVDPQRIGVHGSSQGGALTITTAALRPEIIKCGAAGAPYLCGFMDSAALTHSYPYEEINEYLRQHPDHEPWMRETLAYFDGINFAPDIKASMMVYIGLEDDVCPPETGYAVYNAMTCPKELHASERCAHDAGRAWIMPKVEAFLSKHLAPVSTQHRAEPTVG